MPTYDYRCRNCGHEFEQPQSITAPPLRTCPKCGKRALQRLIGAGGGIIFKGSGFYQTDYRSDSYKKAAEAETKPTSPPAKVQPSDGASSAADGQPSDGKKDDKPGTTGPKDDQAASARSKESGGRGRKRKAS
jgi:putative FmdB family regulatory protein